jgi:hypothetical protein
MIYKVSELAMHQSLTEKRWSVAALSMICRVSELHFFFLGHSVLYIGNGLGCMQNPLQKYLVWLEIGLSLNTECSISHRVGF